MKNDPTMDNDGVLLIINNYLKIYNYLYQRIQRKIWKKINAKKDCK